MILVGSLENIFDNDKIQIYNFPISFIDFMPMMLLYFQVNHL